MKRVRQIFHGALLSALLFEGVQLGLEIPRTLARFAEYAPLSTDRRYARLMPGLWASLEKAKDDIPSDATLWVVSPHIPYPIHYFLHPRRLRWGSPDLRQREAIRRAHPTDWVLTNDTDDRRTDTFVVAPPLAPIPCPMSALAALLLVVALTLIGMSLLPRSLNGKMPWYFIVPAGYVVGSSAVTYGLFIANCAGYVLNHRRVLSIFTAVVFAAVLRLFAVYSRRPRSVSAPSARLSRLEMLCIGMLAIALGTAVLQALTLPPYHPDSLDHFAYRGLVLFTQGTFQSPEFLEANRVHPATDAPLGIPYLEALLYWLLGRCDEGGLKIAFLAYWSAWLALVYSGARVFAPRSLAVYAVTFLGLLPVFFADKVTQAVSGSADIPFACAVTLAAVASIAFVSDRDSSWLSVVAVALLGIAFMKPQGIYVAIWFWAALAFHTNQSRHKVLIAAMLFLVFFAPWIRTFAQLPREFIAPPSSPLPVLLQESVRRFPIVLLAFLYEILNVSRWSLFWLAGAASVAAHLTPGLRPPRRLSLLIVMIAGMALIYLVGYCTLPYSVEALLQASASRWLLHAAGIVAILIAASWSSLDKRGEAL